MRDLPSVISRMIEERDEEVARIGRVLHDEIGQLLTAAGFRLEALRRESSPSPERLDAEIREILAVFDRVITEVRELSHALPFSALERLGLGPALEHVVAERRKATGATIRLMVDPHAKVTGRAAQAMCRIAEEALDNACAHSGAKVIQVLLKPSSRGSALEVKDDGAGFDLRTVEAGDGGFGIALMRHIAARAGLGLVIDSQPGIGTIVTSFLR